MTHSRQVICILVCSYLSAGLLFGREAGHCALPISPPPPTLLCDVYLPLPPPPPPPILSLVLGKKTTLPKLGRDWRNRKAMENEVKQCGDREAVMYV